MNLESLFGGQSSKDIGLSLCFMDLTSQKHNLEEMQRIFNKNQVNAKHFSENSSQILSDPNLVVKIDQMMYASNDAIDVLEQIVIFKQSPSNEQK